ncbi:hypothetical protein KPSA1_03453 [Pseudomonas syringae pv. actinidiae]|uniref:Uncharacterized protein n=1 Tax=Pseudomonas syringae pv. actinidiae TaxID=103796 RepID=A0A2V0QB21_PSESF|nr:hypothetical protein KPSA1_03453 [Pseudomonas syringae pv. actinidiae]
MSEIVRGLPVSWTYIQFELQPNLGEVDDFIKGVTVIHSRLLNRQQPFPQWQCAPSWQEKLVTHKLPNKPAHATAA